MTHAVLRLFHGSPARLLVLALLMLPGMQVAFGEEGHHEAESHEGEAGEQHGSEHSYHPNLIAGFIGITGEDRRETAITLGLD